MSEGCRRAGAPLGRPNLLEHLQAHISEILRASKLLTLLARLVQSTALDSCDDLGRTQVPITELAIPGFFSLPPSSRNNGAEIDAEPSSETKRGGQVGLRRVSLSPPQPGKVLMVVSNRFDCLRRQMLWKLVREKIRSPSFLNEGVIHHSVSSERLVVLHGMRL